MRLAILQYVTASSNTPILFYLNQSTDCMDSNTAATETIVDVALNQGTVIIIVLLEKKKTLKHLFYNSLLQMNHLMNTFFLEDFRNTCPNRTLSYQTFPQGIKMHYI